MAEYTFDDTSQITIPQDPLEQIIGQEKAVHLAKIAARQRRHLLLVGPPGTGKSMIAKAVASLLPSPHQEISVLHNPAKPERPFLEVRTRAQVEQSSSNKKTQPPKGMTLRPNQVPSFVSERLGYRCRACAKYSSPEAAVCPHCAEEKFRPYAGPFDDLVSSFSQNEREDVVHTTRVLNGKEELVIFERVDHKTIRVIDQKDMGRAGPGEPVARNVIVPLDRKLFVQATGASETELLGDVRHDPYGGHQQIGTPAYTRVIPGSIHEAHEGVLFVDEIVSLGNLQRHLLTAMQDKRFPITGRNSSSTGASVRVDAVPCDFVLVSAVNMADVGQIMPALRSRIVGEGYEILVNSVMDDTEANRMRFAQFVAQEVARDGRIPHASREAVEFLLEQARLKARKVDQKPGISLRLRNLSGLIKSAGDFAVDEGASLILPAHARAAMERRVNAEEQMNRQYGSLYKASMSDWEMDLSNPAMEKDSR